MGGDGGESFLTGVFKMLFSIAFGRRKCYYSTCFKESDSWDML